MSNATKVFAPFTIEQVVYLEIWQHVLPVHPFTCGSPEGCLANRAENENVLKPTLEGWVCSCGKYKQDWCHAYMCEKPEWHPIENALQYEMTKGAMEKLRRLYSDDLAISLLTLQLPLNQRLYLLVKEVENLNKLLDHYEQNGPFQEAL